VDNGSDRKLREWEALLAAAREAAKRRDAKGMVAALYESKALDGLRRVFQDRWGGRASPSDVDDAVAKAVDGAYAKLAGGGTVTNLSSWLWKSTENALIDRWHEDLKHRHDGDLSKTADPRAEEPDAGKARYALRAEALRQARSLLPKLGQENVVRVMDYILTAIEEGIPDVPAQQIADALDLNVDTVYVLKQRGFQRLTRLARDQGLHLDRKTLAQLGDYLADQADEETDIQEQDNE
jgi:DNA-directed RNA polymerase specialized sigma24 family protein